MEDKIARVARVYLEPLTPLHIGAGKGGGKPLVDKCIGTGFRLEPEEWPAGQVVSIKVVDGTSQPYIPGSTIKGMLGAMYEFVAGEKRTKELLGSLSKASEILFSDLLLPKELSQRELVRSYQLRCFCPYRVETGKCKDKSRQRVFSHQFVIASCQEAPVVFQGTITFFGESLPRVLQSIFAKKEELTKLLTADGRNPEKELANQGFRSYINSGPFFECLGEEVYTIIWKLGKFVKAYSKALHKGKFLRSGKHRGQYNDLPYAFFALKEGKEEILPGWVKLTIDLTEAREFELNLMGG